MVLPTFCIQKEFLMKRHLCILSMVFTGLLAISINGCGEPMDTVVDTIVDQPTQPKTEPRSPETPGYVFSGTLDHQGTIYAVSFSRDGKTLASLGETDIKFWDPYTGRLKKTEPVVGEVRWITDHAFDDLLRVGGPNSLPFFVTGHTSLVRTLAESGPLLATGSSDKTVRVWDRTTETHKYTLEHDGQVWAVAFSPNGQTLATGGGFEGIYLWDAGTGRSTGNPLIASTGQVEGIAFGPDGHTLVVASGGKTIHVWDLPTNELRGTLVAEGYGVRKIAISPDGKIIAGGAYYPDGPGVLLWKSE